MVMLAEADGPAEDPVIFTPAIFPDNALITFVDLISATSDPVIPWTEYPIAFSALRIPRAVITTSSNWLSDIS